MKVKFANPSELAILTNPTKKRGKKTMAKKKRKAAAKKKPAVRRRRRNPVVNTKPRKRRRRNPSFGVESMLMDTALAAAGFIGAKIAANQIQNFIPKGEDGQPNVKIKPFIEAGIAFGVYKFLPKYKSAAIGAAVAAVVDGVNTFAPGISGYMAGLAGEVHEIPAGLMSGVEMDMLGGPEADILSAGDMAEQEAFLVN